MENIIEMRRIEKSFAATQAVKGASFSLKSGEVHSVIGENGAGKSTMMKILYGMYRPDAGEICVRGECFPELHTRQAIELGIGMVHQEFMLVKELTVLENIILGMEPRKSFSRIDFAKARRELDKYLKDYQFDVRLSKRVEDIPVGEAQRVEIIKTLYKGSNVIILDEPTAVLTPQEAVKLFDIVRSLRAGGASIVFISHKLGEVMDISDRITVMRAGQKVGTVDAKDTNPTELARMMVGKEVFLNVRGGGDVTGGPVFRAEDLYIPGERELSKIRGMTFDVREGEILGVAGVDGNGQQELAEALIGTRQIEKGKITFGGEDITSLPPKARRARKMSYIPENRNTKGLVRDYTIAENMIPQMLNDGSITTLGVVRAGAERKAVNKLIGLFDVRPPDAKFPCKNLSGGNAQKVIVAREVGANPRFLIAAQPTRGVDIGSIEYIRTALLDLKKQGAAILLISADLEEVLSLSDRVMVLYEGRITGIVDIKDADTDNIGLLMTGGEVV